MNKELLQEIISLRKKLHQIPEIAGKEFKTCALIRETLSQIEGVEVLPRRRHAPTRRQRRADVLPLQNAKIADYLRALSTSQKMCYRNRRSDASPILFSPHPNAILLIIRMLI